MNDSVAVVGGGAVGVTAAADLAARGADVTLFERDAVAAGSSGRAAGVVYDAYAEAVDAELADRAIERFRAFGGTGGFDFRRCPYVIAVREGDDDAQYVPEMVERMRAAGREVRVVEPDELGERFPLRTDDLAVAAVAENAGWTDPASYVHAMADRAVAEGVDLRTGVTAGIDPDAPAVVTGPGGEAGTRERFDAVLVAAGAHTKRLLAAAGVPIPLKPYRVQGLTASEPYDGPTVYDATAGAYFRPHPTGLFAGDGTEPVEADPDEWDREADDWFVADVADCLRQRADCDLGDAARDGTDAAAVDRAWAGLCTATPDGSPLLGEVRPDLYVAAGWQGHGFMLSPATGEAVAEEILGGAGIDPYDPTRFDGDESFEIREGMRVENG